MRATAPCCDQGPRAATASVAARVAASVLASVAGSGGLPIAGLHQFVAAAAAAAAAVAAASAAAATRQCVAAAKESRRQAGTAFRCCRARSGVRALARRARWHLLYGGHGRRAAVCWRARRRERRRHARRPVRRPVWRPVRSCAAGPEARRWGASLEPRRSGASRHSLAAELQPDGRTTLCAWSWIRGRA